MKIKIFILVFLNILTSFFVNVLSNEVNDISGSFLALFIFILILLAGLMFYVTSYDTNEEKAFYKIYKYGADGLDLMIEESNRERNLASSVSEVYKNIKEGKIEEATQQHEILEKMKALGDKFK